MAAKKPSPLDDPANWQVGPNGRRIYVGPISDKRAGSRKRGGDPVANIDQETGLTHRQRLFCEAYVLDRECYHNATAAYRKAGYRHQTPRVGASQLMRNPRVQAYIKTLQHREAKKITITPETVLRDIERVREKAEQAEQYGHALKALELLGKHLALFTDRIEYVRSIEDTTDEELWILTQELLEKLPPKQSAVMKALIKDGQVRPAAKAEETSE